MIQSLRQQSALSVAFFIIIALALITGIFLAYVSAVGAPDLEPEQSGTTDTVVLEGTYVCLTPNDGSTPRECSPGLETSDGLYALDLGDLIGAGGNAQLANGTKIFAGGTLIAVEDISSEQWDKYDVTHVMRVLEIARQ